MSGAGLLLNFEDELEAVDSVGDADDPLARGLFGLSDSCDGTGRAILGAGTLADGESGSGLGDGGFESCR
jgi:hypothetical protein